MDENRTIEDIIAHQDEDMEIMLEILERNKSE